MRCVAPRPEGIQPPPPAVALIDELVQRGIPARPVIRDGRREVRAELPGAPTAGTHVRYVRSGVSWCYVSEWGGDIGGDAGAAADYVCWLMGVRPGPPPAG